MQPNDINQELALLLEKFSNKVKRHFLKKEIIVTMEPKSDIQFYIRSASPGIATTMENADILSARCYRNEQGQWVCE